MNKDGGGDIKPSFAAGNGFGAEQTWSKNEPVPVHAPVKANLVAWSRVTPSRLCGQPVCVCVFCFDFVLFVGQCLR